MYDISCTTSLQEAHSIKKEKKDLQHQQRAGDVIFELLPWSNDRVRSTTSLASSYKLHMPTERHTEAHQQDSLLGLTSPETIAEVGVEGWRQMDRSPLLRMGAWGGWMEFRSSLNHMLKKRKRKKKKISYILVALSAVYIYKGKRREHERGSITHKDKHFYHLSHWQEAKGLQKPPHYGDGKENQMLTLKKNLLYKQFTTFFFFFWLSVILTLELQQFVNVDKSIMKMSTSYHYLLTNSICHVSPVEWAISHQ